MAFFAGDSCGRKLLQSFGCKRKCRVIQNRRRWRCISPAPGGCKAGAPSNRGVGLLGCMPRRHHGPFATVPLPKETIEVRRRLIPSVAASVHHGRGRSWEARRSLGTGESFFVVRGLGWRAATDAAAGTLTGSRRALSLVVASSLTMAHRAIRVSVRRFAASKSVCGKESRGRRVPNNALKLTAAARVMAWSRCVSVAAAAAYGER